MANNAGYCQLQQADRSGFVSVKFNKIELLDGAREKIDAIGTGLDLGPIKGNVYGKNTGKNFLVALLQRTWSHDTGEGLRRRTLWAL